MNRAAAEMILYMMRVNSAPATQSPTQNVLRELAAVSRALIGCIPSRDKMETLCILLDITAEQSERLLQVSKWPRKFQFKYALATSTQRELAVLCERIEHMIKTGE